MKYNTSIKMQRFGTMVIICLVFLINTMSGQELYIPYNIKQAISKGTRTKYGVPGSNYFQNYTNYKIEASFNPKNGILTGQAGITYFNNSNDTLKKIVIRLYQNMYRAEEARDEAIEKATIQQGVNINMILLDGENISKYLKYRTRTDGTNLTVFLSKSLEPNDSCSVFIEWDFQMPGTPVERFGKYDESTYFIGYWYPQVAVYDDIDGWDEMQYTGTHEFYNDFNNFDVKIKLPAGCMLWATGNWNNPEEILSQDILKCYQKAQTSDDVQHIIQNKDIVKKTIFCGKRSNTFHFQAENIPDFAFAVSDKYLWDAASVIVDSVTNQRMTVSAVYPVGSRDFPMVASIGSDVIRRLSFESYGIPYPFPSVTIFNGDEGMEYPMMVNNGSMFSKDGTTLLTLHEVAHAYFPFLTGINERKYSWIDEGLTTYLPAETEKAMNSNYYPIESIIRNYDAYAGTESDIPLIVPAYQTREFSYKFYSYFRSAAAFNMLEKFLGRDTFRLAIKEFIITWQYKHPVPCDLFAVFQKISKKDISWFINKWFFESGWTDLSIGEVTLNDKSLSVEIIKAGSFPVPVILKLTYRNGKSDTIEKGAEVWHNNDTLIIKTLLRENIERLDLGNFDIPDKNRSDNTYHF
jgi:hypothetical protein